MSEGKLLRSIGLHYCSRYRNIVRFDRELCGKCPYNKPNPQTEVKAHQKQTSQQL